MRISKELGLNAMGIGYWILDCWVRLDPTQKIRDFVLSALPTESSSSYLTRIYRDVYDS